MTNNYIVIMVNNSMITKLLTALFQRLEQAHDIATT